MTPKTIVYCATSGGNGRFWTSILNPSLESTIPGELHILFCPKNMWNGDISHSLERMNKTSDFFYSSLESITRRDSRQYTNLYYINVCFVDSMNERQLSDMKKSNETLMNYFDKRKAAVFFLTLLLLFLHCFYLLSLTSLWV